LRPRQSKSGLETETLEILFETSPRQYLPRFSRDRDFIPEYFCGNSYYYYHPTSDWSKCCCHETETLQGHFTTFVSKYATDVLNTVPVSDRPR